LKNASCKKPGRKRGAGRPCVQIRRSKEGTGGTLGGLGLDYDWGKGAGSVAPMLEKLPSCAYKKDRGTPKLQKRALIIYPSEIISRKKKGVS